MKRVLLLALTLLVLSPAVNAEDKKKKTTTKKDETKEINWISLDEVQAKMKKNPKKVYIDVYTGWCGWCKVMDKKTFTHPEVIKYINKNFYAVKLDAEQRDSIRFMGKTYGFLPEYKANLFAVELLQGQMSYPTTVILHENFQDPQPVPGYLDVPTIEKILKYLGENIYKNQKFEDFIKSFTPTWQPQPAQG